MTRIKAAQMFGKLICAHQTNNRIYNREKVMKAIVMTHHGEADVLQLSESVPKPDPGPGQALVRIHAAGVNFVDIYQRRGTYPVKLPFIPGLEASGVVEAVRPTVRNVEPGSRVAYTPHPGTNRECRPLQAKKLVPLPD